jgi:hypothetical protein
LKLTRSEALNEVEKACDLYTDDIAWEAPARNILLRNKQDVMENYRKMFASVEDVEFHTLQRFATEDRVVDDSIARFKLIGSDSVPAPIGSQIEMRLVHIFEMRETKIAKETALYIRRRVFSSCNGGRISARVLSIQHPSPGGNRGKKL